jgi:phosphomannomutase
MSFEHLTSIYRDFDIRGLYGTEITDDEVYKIARALAVHFPLRSVAVGYDIRPSASALFTALTRGFRDSGVHVINLGLCTTPMSYFICGSTDVDMTVMITASHMPSQYNGLKISVDDAKPVTRDILQIVRGIVGTHTFSEEVLHGSLTNHALQPDWIASFKSRHDLRDSGLSLVIDPANMIGILEIDTFKAFEPDITVHTIFDTYDHTCPNHEANPIKLEALAALSKEVIARQASLGIAFDGDADRVGFVDERGIPVPSDIIGTLIAKEILRLNPGAKIVADVRSSLVLDTEVNKLGGFVVREKVGHTHIRHRMREENALLGIEVSGHFFFKETYYSEGGPLPAFLIMELMHREKKKLSELTGEVNNLFQSGEINSNITRSVQDIYEDIVQSYPQGTIERLDGLTVRTPNWWCNLRPSANDPVVRLNVEAVNKDCLTKITAELVSIIRK